MRRAHSTAGHSPSQTGATHSGISLRELFTTDEARLGHSLRRVGLRRPVERPPPFFSCPWEFLFSYRVDGTGRWEAIDCPFRKEGYSNCSTQTVTPTR